MSNYVFSMDSHVVEPRGLWQELLPASLKDRGLRSERDGPYITMIGDNKPIHRMQVGDGVSDNPRIGGVDPALRIKDMLKDGIDGELIFPNLGMLAYVLEDKELELACIEVYNDWLMKNFAGNLDAFVPCAVLPLRDVSESLGEFKRVVANGYRAVMLPTLVTGDVQYNNPALDPIWAYAQEKKIPVCFHVATGQSPISERGPGAALINYMSLGFSTQEMLCYLVGGGALDRHPGLNAVVIEAGASWMASLGERMDEVYRAHQYYVKPKLTRLPSEILYSQVKATFQFDQACLRNVAQTGHECLMWASDYPHMEGTFPRSQQVIEEVFSSVEVSPEIKADILGISASKMFGLKPQKLKSQGE